MTNPEEIVEKIIGEKHKKRLTKDKKSKDSWMPDMGRQPVTWYERGGQQ